MGMDPDIKKENDDGENKGFKNQFDVLFPYDRIYPEQQQFIDCVMKAISKKGHALIEVPPGTNQSLCLMSSLTSYQQQQQKEEGPTLAQRNNDNTNNGIIPRRRIIYATNSLPETSKVMGELAVVMDYRQQTHKRRSLNNNNNNNNNNNDNNNTTDTPSSRYYSQPHKILFENVEDGFWKSTASIRTSDNHNDSSNARIQNYNNQHAATTTTASDHHNDETNRVAPFPFLALCLVGSDRTAVDDACRSSNDDNMDTDEFENPPPTGLFASLQQLHDWAFNGKRRLWSSWQQLTKYAILNANVLVVTYPYLLDPMTARMIGSAIYDKTSSSSSSSSNDINGNTNNKENETSSKSSSDNKNKSATNETNTKLSSDAIVVFDHAHNIDAACMDALSATVKMYDLEQATRSLDKLSSEIARFKQQQQHNQSSNDNNNGNDNNNNVIKTQNIPYPLCNEYKDLVQHPIDNGMYRPILFHSDDVVHEPVPGNIRHTKHFIGCMKKIVEHFKVRLRWATDQHSNRNSKNKPSNKKKKTGTGSVSSLAFLHQMMNATALDSKTLRFVHSRVLSMLRTLKLPKEPFAGLINVAYLASLLGFTKTLESSKFAIVLERTSVVIGHHGKQAFQGSGSTTTGMLQVVCLDPSFAIQPIFDQFDTVILTSSTLSPLHFYPKILQFEPVVAESIPMTTIRPCVNPIMISRGSDQLGISTNYKERFTMGCIRNYGKMLVDLVSTIPDGVVVYFPSYNYMEALICEWDATGIMREMTEWKLVFVETKDNLELNAIALDNYRASCDIGRGGIFFSVARGSISEAVPFDLHYGRALVMIGIPYEYTLSKVVQARLEYIQTHFDIREQDYLTFDALRQVAKCFGRVVRSKTDYGVLVFADNRFHRTDKKTKLPSWVTQFLSEAQQDLTTDTAVVQIKSFLRQTGQPIDQSLLQKVLTHC